jgi:hypothetical protein
MCEMEFAELRAARKFGYYLIPPDFLGSVQRLICLAHELIW